MDFFSNPQLPQPLIHFAALQRHHPSRLTVVGMGIIPGKTAWMRHRFTNYSFSFLLRGSGVYHAHGRRFAVEAPCVLTQQHGLDFHYGPGLAHDDRLIAVDGAAWDELFISFAAECGDELRRLGFIDAQWPCWRVGDPRAMLHHLDALVRLAYAGELHDAADLIDRLAESAVLASLRDQSTARDDPGLAVVLAAAALIEAQPERPFDIEVFARTHQLSSSTFRRRWQQQHGEPPHRFQDRARMRRACRLLAERDLPVAAIAQRLGYDDPLYFSRRFRAIIGTTASQYRERHRLAIRR